MKLITLHSDGGCHGNPGPGGWGATLIYNGHRKELSGGALATTNNRMELTAAIEALRALKEPCQILLYTDSQYVKNGITQWMYGWKKNGWKTSTKAPVKNADLWRALDAARSPHQIEWKWLKGHAGHEQNERCDQLATAAIHKIKETHSAAELKAALREFEAAQDNAGSTAATSLLD